MNNRDAAHLNGCLQGRLDEAFLSVTPKRVVVTLLADGCVQMAGVTSEPEPETDPANWRFPTGCLTKLFTGALMNRAIRDGLVRLDDDVAELLDEKNNHIESFRGTTINDLLDHMHGIDDSAVERTPLDQDGFIDVGRLLDVLVPHRFSSPGTIYSYSSAGAWLMAAILERLRGKPFTEQLSSELLEPLGIPFPLQQSAALLKESSHICASTGATLAVSARDMLAFLEAEVLTQAHAWPPAVPDTAIKPLPGWNAFERGIFRGWKHHGEYWFGHNSVRPRASAMVRVQPQRGIAVVIASKYHPAPAVAAKLFATLLPEYKTLTIPRPLNDRAAERLKVDGYSGRYRSAAEALVVHASDGQLRFSAPNIDAALIPVGSDMFFLRPPLLGRFSFVQFLERDGMGFRYLWDGARVFRRCE